MASEYRVDIAVIGGGLGGVAAALSAARHGCSVLLSEETDWIGGQLTAQAVPPDEHRYIETHGGTRLYREFRGRVRDYYRRNYPLTEEARANERLNPGNGGVSRLCHEPRVALAVLHEMLAPYISGGAITLLTEHRPVAADTAGDRVRTVSLRNLRSGDEVLVHSAYFIDATELGDLLPLSGTEYVTGAESRSETGEPHAPPEARPANIQAFTCCFAMEHRPGENHILDKPRDYEFWRNYVPDLRPPWPGRLLSWDTTHPHTLEARTHLFDPENEKPGRAGLWLYRRIADRANFAPGAYPSDICLVNWPQNDYWLGNLHGTAADGGARPEDRCASGPDACFEYHFERGKQLSMSLLYWMQTEAPRPDGGTGWPGLRLRGDVTGTADGLAKYPYIRESRRIRAEFTVLEQHVGKDTRAALTGQSPEEVRAEVFPDSVGTGYYRLDLHPSSGGDNYIDVESLYYQIPLGALIPVRMENLLPGAKNLGVTHITNGCYRLHPTEWNIGEAAGAIAAFALAHASAPRAIRNTPVLLVDFQREIEAHGVDLIWPEDG